MKTRSAAAKLTVFALTSLLVLVVMWNTLGNSLSGPTTKVTALFTNASGLQSGDSVRIAGVKVGRVESVELDGNHAKVILQVEEGHPVLTDTRLLIRYENLLGRRFISLRAGHGDGTPLSEGDVVPVSRTEPAFDITVLMNGFQPIFDLLSKDDINKLSDTIIKVLQGEGATVEDLLAHAGRVTGNIADHDVVIGEVITNLSAVLGQLESNDDQFAGLIGDLSSLVNGLNKNHSAITGAIESVDSLTAAVDAMVRDTRPSVRATLTKANGVFAMYARERALLDDLLKALPEFFASPARVAQHGSWITLYPCEIKTQPFLPVDVFGAVGHKHSEVCR